MPVFHFVILWLWTHIV